MICDAVQTTKSKPTEGTSGLRPYCIATSVGFLFGVEPMIDLTNQVFGRLTVIREADPRYFLNGKRQRRWHCACECGENRDIFQSDLRSAKTKSCGCYKREVSTTHGACKSGSSTPIYSIWAQMLARCGNPQHPHYHNYGGRGIAVCCRWRESF